MRNQRAYGRRTEGNEETYHSDGCNDDIYVCNQVPVGVFRVPALPNAYVLISYLAERMDFVYIDAYHCTSEKYGKTEERFIAECLRKNAQVSHLCVFLLYVIIDTSRECL